jgi:hypothetical protein
MSVPLIIPKQTLRQRFVTYSPQVKAALITSTVTAIIALLSLVFSVMQNSRLRQEIASKDTKIQDLQTELAPFKAFAVEKFSSSDAAAMRKLAEHLASVDVDLKKAYNEIDALTAKAEIPALRAVVSIRPNGRQVSYASGARNSPSKTMSVSDSALSPSLHEALGLMRSNKHSEALQRLQSLINDFPEWPYSYFYRAMITKQTNDFQAAVDRCGAFRKARIAEPEHLLFEAMGLTFLKQWDDARALVKGLKGKQISVEDVPLFYISKQTPADIRAEFEPIIQSMQKSRPPFP